MTRSGALTRGVPEQVADLGRGCPDRGGALLGPAPDHRTFDGGNENMAASISPETKSPTRATASAIR
ncbi:hypothetical protein ACFWFF_11430 [Streptomyces sp. NPDC060223]|uniref:hypothetical protein n=1 Tax=Streptomyces sp. NPDC060223 TaxID=3347077 RepID=UPI0036481E26